jgi:hypothetical protein
MSTYKNNYLRITAFSRDASLPHKAFALQISQNHGLQSFCPDPHDSRPLQKFAMPLQPHWPPLFCPLSPEAFLLTRGDVVSEFIPLFSTMSLRGKKESHNAK